ncbi:MAG: hypothetical protein NTU78_16380, partial [Alphaproteobacteria bacterium]|nr:hypothetical protein [Alphaproteobacteria bacterium]
DKIVGKVVGWDCCAEGIRVALFFGSDGAGLLVDFVGDPLRAEELPRLAAALGKNLRLARADAAIRPAWRQVWTNEME